MGPPHLPRYGRLTSVEQALVGYVSRGEVLDLAARGEAIDEASMRSWGESRTCRAPVIRDILRGLLATDPDPHGLRLRGARISGRLDLENITTDVNLELIECFLEEGILVRDARLTALGLIGCRIEHPSEPPLDAQRLTCATVAVIKSQITGHSAIGAVNLVDAHIRSTLNCDGAILRNSCGPALFADGLQVGQGMFLRKMLTLDTANPVFAAGSEFTAIGAGKLGAVRLLGAHIGGFIDWEGAHLHNNSGPSLYADSLQVDTGLLFRGGFTATGAGSFGAVRLCSVQVGGELQWHQAVLRNESGPALFARALRVDESMFLTDGFTATGGGDGAAVDLTDAQVSGAFMLDNSAQVMHVTDPCRRITVNGMTYARVPEPISSRDWLRLLQEATPRYAAQPYQQLAAGCRALGDERGAREVLMAQRDAQLTRTRPRPRWREQLWGKITKYTLGYGYQPWRALLFLAGVVALSCVFAIVLGSHGALTQTAHTTTPGRPCTLVQQVGVGLDLNLPIGSSMARADCGLAQDPASATAAWLTLGVWGLRALAWAFAALFIAGFTSAVRKT